METATDAPLARTTRDFLAAVHVACVRVALDADGEAPGPELLRSVWGAALADIDPEAYQRVFEGAPPERVSRFAWRTPLEPRPEDERRPRYELLLFDGEFARIPTWRAALRLALERGLGRGRRGATLVGEEFLAATGEALPRLSPFTLSGVPWPIVGDPECDPVRIVATSPWRLLRNKRLIQGPGLTDVVVAGWRRVVNLLPSERRRSAERHGRELLRHARGVRCSPWRGRPERMTRWSARQGRRIRLDGVIGSFVLPEGAGPLAPLLAALEWLHLGKATTVGFGGARLDDVEEIGAEKSSATDRQGILGSR